MVSVSIFRRDYPKAEDAKGGHLVATQEITVGDLTSLLMYSA